MDNDPTKPVTRPPHEPSRTQSSSRGPGLPCLRSDSLFGKAREILIEHSGCYYRLRVTHSNKLILTK
jgi:hemin uptake protein HemP